MEMSLIFNFQIFQIFACDEWWGRVLLVHCWIIFYLLLLIFIIIISIFFKTYLSADSKDYNNTVSKVVEFLAC